MDLCGGGSGGLWPDVHYSGEKLLTQLFLSETNLSNYALL